MDDRTQIYIERLSTESDPIAKAKLLLEIKREQLISLAKLCSLIKMTPSYMSHLLRLNKLPILVIEGFYSDLISLTHLFIIARLNTEQEMVLLYEKVLGQDLTVGQTEELVREELYRMKNEGSFITPGEKKSFMLEIEKQGFEGKIVQSHTRAKLTVSLKGNLQNTTQKLRDLMQKITSV
ncbi:MAG: hypothetical protein AAB966_04600 [Patescibacteria group bacterium]